MKAIRYKRDLCMRLASLALAAGVLLLAGCAGRGYVRVPAGTLTSEQLARLRPITTGADTHDVVQKMDEHNVKHDFKILLVDGTEFPFRDFCFVEDIVYPHMLVCSGPWDWASGYRFILRKLLFLPPYTDVTIIDLSTKEIVFEHRVAGKINRAMLQGNRVLFRMGKNKYGAIDYLE